MRMVSLVLAALASAGVALAQGEVSTNWFRSPAVSPDGKTVVFTHAGDLYSVSIDGGRAVPLTVHEAYETRPVFSRDGSMLAFASDRHGNFDVFVMPSEGGAATRLTHHQSDDHPTDFAPDGSAVLFHSSRGDDVDSALFPTARLPELYRVSIEGGTPEMVLTSPAVEARYDRSGGRMLYEIVKGYEDPLRKHHTSSVTREIWVYDVASGRHTELTDYKGEDRDPEWTSDNRGFYFLSEREGAMNVFRQTLRPGLEPKRLTDFKNHPVRDLSASPEGTVVFSWHGELYRMIRDGKPERIEIEVTVEGRGDEMIARTERSGATEFAVSPNGKEIAFVVRGEVFVTSVDFGTTRRITSTPEQERSVHFSPDGRSIVYAGERGGSWNVYEASLADDDELYFFSATKIEERPLIATDAEEFQPRYSPDGEKVAYLHNRSAIHVYDIESGETETALPADWYYSYSDGDHWLRWSPDSEWLAVHFYDRGRAFVHEAGVVPADGSTRPMDLSKSGYDDVRPHWAMDGGAVAWATARYGKRSHGSWGAEYDVVASFLTQDAWDRFRLSKEEYELRKEREETENKKDEPEEENAEKEEAKDENGVSPVAIEEKGLEARTERLTIHSSDLGEFALTSGGEKLFYLARFEKGYDLWVRDFREESTKILTKLGAADASMILSEDEKTIFLLADGSLSKIDASSGAKTPISFAAELRINASEEREYLFEHVWRQTMQKFYRPDMHGVDWAFYREQYEPKLEGITNNRDLAIVFSEMLGELNASHTGGRYRPGREDGDASTASLGAFLEQNDAGLRIVEIMTGGPLDRSDVEIQEGMVIRAIDGESVAGANLSALLDGKAGARVRLSVEREGGDRFDQVVRPVSQGEEGRLRYDRWVEQRRAIVDEASGGRLGYVHVQGMNDPSFRDVYSEVLGRYFDREGLVVDTRFNGGGWLHDDLVTFLTGHRYVDLYPRDDASPDATYLGDTSRRWTKPSIVVMSEGNYSDAHFFPWAYTELGIGETVGMPVPGTSTAVWWERLHTGDLIFGIPQVGTKGDAGVYLENQELLPTHLVELRPEDAAAGRDTQLEEAVRRLLDAVDTK